MIRSLKSGINSAGNGDQVWVAEGTYTPTSNSGDIAASFKITQDGLKLYGGFVGTETSIDDRKSPLPVTKLSGDIGSGSHSTHVVELVGNHIMINGVTISDGYAIGLKDGENYCIDCFGGGIFILNSETSAADGNYNYTNDNNNNNHNRIKGKKNIQRNRNTNGNRNRYTRNGKTIGIFGEDSMTVNYNYNNVQTIPDNEKTYYYTLSQVTLSNNKAIQGGGIFSYAYIELTIEDCIFTNNEAFDGTDHAGAGGALFSTYHSTIIVSNSQFTNNIASTAGGAISIDYGITATISDSIFGGNNVTYGHGGAIYMTDRNSNSGDTTLTSENCQYTNNYASGYGGAIFMYYDSIGDLQTNTFSSNIAGMAGGALGLYNVQCRGCCDIPGPNTFSGNSVVQDIKNTGTGKNIENINYKSTKNRNTDNKNNKQNRHDTNINVNNIADEQSISSSAGSSTDNCYIDYFDYIGKTSTNTNALQYLETLWNHRDPNNEPPDRENVIYVDGSKTDINSGDGSSWLEALSTIQDGINKALVDGPGKSEIWVRGGNGNSNSNEFNYIPTEIPYWYNKTAIYYNSEKSKMIYLRNHIYLFGGFDGTETQRSQRNWVNNPTTITGQLTQNLQTYQVVYMDSGSYIDGFIIRNGHSYEGGILLHTGDENRNRNIRFNQTTGKPISDPYKSYRINIDDHDDKFEIDGDDIEYNRTVGRNSNRNDVLCMFVNFFVFLLTSVIRARIKGTIHIFGFCLFNRAFVVIL